RRRDVPLGGRRRDGWRGARHPAVRPAGRPAREGFVGPGDEGGAAGGRGRRGGGRRGPRSRRDPRPIPGRRPDRRLPGHPRLSRALARTDGDAPPPAGARPRPDPARDHPRLRAAVPPLDRPAAQGRSGDLPVPPAGRPARGGRAGAGDRLHLRQADSRPGRRRPPGSRRPRPAGPQDRSRSRRDRRPRRSRSGARGRSPVILAGDVGGTQTRLGLFRSGVQGELEPAGPFSEFPSPGYPGLADVVLEFLGASRGQRGSIEAACFGIPGPVVLNRAKAPNLPWPELDGAEIAERLGLAPERAILVNDLAAAAAGLDRLGPGQLEELQAGVGASAQGSRALVSAGTGLGIALQGRAADGGWTTLPTEGGHVDFAPRDEEEWQLCRYVAVLPP